MADKALRGNRLTKQPKMSRRPRMGQAGPSMGRQPPKEIDSLEALGTYTSGGIEGKPHSTKEGRRAAGANLLNRAWGQKYTKKKGISVQKMADKALTGVIPEKEKNND